METIEINIDNYLTEEEKKEIIIDAYRERVRTELFRKPSGTALSDNEIQRIVGNIAYEAIFNEINQYIPNFKELIKEKTIRTIKEKDNYSFFIFRSKDIYDNEEGLAIKYINEAIEESKELIKEKIRDAIINFNYTESIKKEILNEIDKLVTSIYKLSDFILNNG